MIEFTNKSTATLYKTNASDLDVARAAWVSQDAEAHRKEKEPGRVEGLINYLWKNNHTSPFEHGQFTFIIECPLFVAREFHRHRTWSYNEISGRYTVLPYKFYVPDVATRPLVQEGKVGAYIFKEGSYQQKGLVVDAYKRMANRANAEYESLLNAGVAKEVARGVLTVSQMTTFWATTNPRNLMHFLSLRNSPDALYEIRQLAGEMEDAFAQTMPLVHKAFRSNSDGRGV